MVCVLCGDGHRAWLVVLRWEHSPEATAVAEIRRSQQSHPRRALQRARCGREYFLTYQPTDPPASCVSVPADMNLPGRLHQFRTFHVGTHSLAVIAPRTNTTIARSSRNDNARRISFCVAARWEQSCDKSCLVGCVDTTRASLGVGGDPEAAQLRPITTA